LKCIKKRQREVKKEKNRLEILFSFLISENTNSQLSMLKQDFSLLIYTPQTTLIKQPTQAPV
jgi:hypothetical protein